LDATAVGLSETPHHGGTENLVPIRT
jgi:hypothetical protein